MSGVERVWMRRKAIAELAGTRSAARGEGAEAAAGVMRVASPAEGVAMATAASQGRSVEAWDGNT